MIISRAFLLSVAFSFIAASASDFTDLDIVFSLRHILVDHQWLVDRKYKQLASNLARSGIMAAAAEVFDNLYNHLPYVYVLSHLKTMRKMKYKMKGHRCVWILMKKYNELMARDLPLGFRDIVLFVSDNEVVSVYSISPMNPTVVETLQVDDVGVQTIGKLQTFISLDRRSLAGAAIIVSKADDTVDCEKLEELDPYGVVRCHHEDLMEMMATMDHFTLNITSLPPDFNLRYAYTFPNGSYSGLFAQLLESSVDISAGSFVAVPERVRDFDFAWPTFGLRSAMYMKETTGDVNWTSYYEPLHGDVWIAVLASFILAAVALVIVQRYEPLGEQTFCQEFLPEDAVFSSFQLLSFQGVSNMPETKTFRIIYLFLLMTIIILMPAYSGSLISYLAVKRQLIPFNTLEEYLEDGRYKIVTLADGFISWYLRFVSSVDLSHVLVPQSEAALTDDEGYNKVCRGRRTYVTLQAGFSPEGYECRLMVLPITLLIQYFGLGLPKNSQLTERISQGINRFRTFGIIQRMSSQFSKYNGDKVDVPFSSVTFNAVMPLLAVLSVGILLSMLLFVMERRWALKGRN